MAQGSSYPLMFSLVPIGGTSTPGWEPLFYSNKVGFIYIISDITLNNLCHCFNYIVLYSIGQTRKHCGSFQTARNSFIVFSKSVNKFDVIAMIKRGCILIISTKGQLSLLCVLPVNCREMYILKFILTFRLAMDARLHQKNRTQGVKPTLSESSKKI